MCAMDTFASVTFDSLLLHRRTAPVAAAAAQALEASVFIELPAIPTADPATLLTLRHPLHLVLLGTQNQLLPSTSGHHSLSASPQPSTSPVNIAQASSSGQSQGSAPGHSGWTHGARNEAAARSVHPTGTLPGTLTMSAPPAAPATFITTGLRGPDRSSTATTAAHAADSMAANRSVSLIGTGYAEWRTVLASRAASCSVAVDLIRPELGGNGTEVVANVKLDLTVHVLPSWLSYGCQYSRSSDAHVHRSALQRHDVYNSCHAWLVYHCYIPVQAVIEA